MKLFLLGIAFGWFMLVVAAVVYAVFIAKPEPAHRRANGFCAVPGCGRPAGHWKVS